MSNKSTVPKHIAIIPDGNRRWAKQKGVSLFSGHKKGIEVFEEIEDVFQKEGVEILTIYAFSTENWNRPAREIKYLMTLLKKAIKNKIKKFNKNNIKLIVSGRIHDLSVDLQESIKEAVEMTKNNTKGIVNIALNYGGRDEIIGAIKKIVEEKKIKIENLTEDIFGKYLYTNGLPDPDLMIRTSGEQRTSNFLPWQLAYTELYFCKKNWPDFGAKDFSDAIGEYQKRQRNFGK